MGDLVRAHHSDEEVLQRFPHVAIDHDNIGFHRAQLTRRLIVSRCVDCGRLGLPERTVCTACRSRRLEPHEVSGRGTVYLLTGDRSGGVIVTVELEEQAGLRFSAPFAGERAAVEIGARVQLGWCESDGGFHAAFRRP